MTNGKFQFVSGNGSGEDASFGSDSDSSSEDSEEEKFKAEIQKMVGSVFQLIIIYNVIYQKPTFNLLNRIITVRYSSTIRIVIVKCGHFY